MKTAKQEPAPEGMISIRDSKTGKEVLFPKNQIVKLEPGKVPAEPYINKDAHLGGGLSLRGEPLTKSK